MKVEGIDERRVVREGIGGNFVVFVYEGSEQDPGSSVDSYLITDADIPSALGWLERHLPVNACWSLGVVEDPENPTAHSDLRISWVVGADVLNMSPRHRGQREQSLVQEMLERRNGTTLAGR